MTWTIKEMTNLIGKTEEQIKEIKKQKILQDKNIILIDTSETVDIDTSSINIVKN